MSKSSESTWETTSGTSVTRFDQLRRLYDEWVYAPFTILWEDWRSQLGFSIIVFYILIGTVGTKIVKNPSPNQGEPLIPPFTTLEFPLGTDGIGQGLLALIVHATPAMLIMITTGAVFSIVVATVVGTLSGYKGGRIDSILMTVTDIAMTIPGLPLVIVLSAILQPRSPAVVGVILAINAWAGLARALRSQVLTLRNDSYVEASRVMGIGTPAILAVDIIPNLMPFILINFVNAARAIIFGSVGLYFLGILPFSNLNWGVVLNLAYNTGGALYTLAAAHWLLVPMATITLLSFGLIIFAQGTDRMFNPQVRARHAETVSMEGEEAMEDVSSIDN